MVKFDPSWAQPFLEGRKSDENRQNRSKVASGEVLPGGDRAKGRKVTKSGPKSDLFEGQPLGSESARIQPVYRGYFGQKSVDLGPKSDFFRSGPEIASETAILTTFRRSDDDSDDSGTFAT